jgi:hypothetical protein
MEEILTGVIITSGAALLNFVATKTYNLFTGETKNIFWQNKYGKITELKSQAEFNDLKRRIRTVVIDDEDSFPVNLFQAEGYSIDKWPKVLDYGKLESGFYDIIVLDIKGVAQHISEDDGLGVLESLKKTNPAQIIIAFSQHSYDLSKARFWEMADDKIAKPSDFLKIKGTIDTLIKTKFKPDRYINTLHDVLRKNNISERDIKRLDTQITKSIKDKRNPDWNTLLNFVNNKTELVNQLIAIGNTFIKFFQ